MSATMADRIRLIIDTDEAVRMAVRLASMKRSKSPSEVVNEILREALKAELMDAKKYVPKKPKED